MKKISSLILLIIMICIISNCHNKKNQYSNVTPINTSQEAISVDTSSKIGFSKSTDSIVFDNENYKIIISPDDQYGCDSIGVYNKFKKKSFSIDEGDSYYFAVVDSFIIVDSGTGVSGRGLSIYNLNSAKIVFSDRYEGELVIDNKSVKFLKKVEIYDIPDSTKLPKFPDEWKDVDIPKGYVKVQIFNLIDMKLIETGQYECWEFGD